MSLINKMLQDLEQRSPDGGAGNSIHVEVRAATTSSSSMHPAWWIALSLAAMVVAMAAWLWQSRTVPGDSHAAGLQTKQLLLKSEGPLVQARNAEPNTAAKQTPAAAVTSTPHLPLAVAMQAAKVSPPAATPADRSADRSAAAGDAKLKAAESIAALNAVKQVKELTPQQRAENEYRKAVSLMQQAKTAEAVSGFEQALQLDPLHAGARQTLVALLLENKRVEEGIHRASDGLRLDPGQTGLAMILARVQVDKGELSAAIDTLQHSLSYAFERADYNAFLAALLQRAGRHKEATEKYLVALRNAPQNGVWWMGLGISLQADGRDADAQDAFLRAKSSNTLSPELQAFVDQKLSELQR